MAEFIPTAGFRKAQKAINEKPKKRPKLVSTGEKYRRYNAKRKERGTRSPCKFDYCKFICFDGEGINIGPPVDLLSIANSSRKHAYNRVQAYCEGQEFELQQDTRLTTWQIFEFLIGVTDKIGPKFTAMVGFHLGYDFLHILHDLTKEQAIELLKLSKPQISGQKKFFRIPYRDRLYQIDYRPGKYLTCNMYLNKNGPIWKSGAKKPRAPDGRFQLWDVAGFFTGTFVKVIEEWLGADYVDLPLIRKFKDLRGEFDKEDPDDIARYNLAEVKALELIMKKLHGALGHPDVGLKLARWDGSGAVASAIFGKANIKKHLQDTDVLYPAVHEAARYAFAGGRIEMGELGFTMEPVYHADINSAYPSAMCQLPSLASGQWKHGIGGVPPRGFTLVRVFWHFPADLKYYPFFWRSEHGSIVFCQAGEGWYWFPEYEVACEYDAHYKANGIQVLEWWHWEADSDEKPFASFINPMYTRRLELKDLKRDGAAQIVLKLGLNSLYGKLCQQLGAVIDENGVLIKKPPFFQIEYAGFITSYTRAKLLRDIIPQLDSVISFATDAVFSHAELPMAKSKALGGWGKEKHDGMVAIAPGVYTLIDGEEQKSWTRGYPNANARGDFEAVKQAWENSETKLKLKPRSHMITLKEALRSEELWPFRGCFRLKERQQTLDGSNAKRQPVDLETAKPHTRMVTTKVRETLGGMSRIYKLGWKQAERDDIETAKNLQEDDYG
jgi:DNA polymerase type B, organellar and viral